MRNKAEVERRVKILKFWSIHGLEATMDAFAVSRATLFRWQQALDDSQGNAATLEQVVRHYLYYPWRRQVWLETDLRAHRNPGRLQDIAAATNALIDNLATRCPTCTTPGFVVTAVERGALCRACGLPTEQVLAESRVCAQCEHTENTIIASDGVSPEWCSRCNP